MNDDDGTGRPKLEAAKEALSRVVDGLPDDAEVGLRLYGSKLSNVSKQEGCQDTELASPVETLDRTKLKDVDRVDHRQRPHADRPRAPEGRQGPAPGRPPDGDPRLRRRQQLRAAFAVPGGQAARGRRRGPAHRGDRLPGRRQARRQLECIAAAGDGAYRDAQDAGELADCLQSLSVRALRRFDASGIPIAGGPDAARATAVPRPGQYLDSIAPNETRFYKVPVGLGQKLDVCGTVIARIPGVRGLFARFDLEIDDPGGDLVDNDSSNEVGGESVSSVASTDQITEPRGLRRRRPRRRLPRPITLDDPDGVLPGRRYPVELLFRLKGTKVNPAPADATEATPAPKKAPEAGRARRAHRLVAALDPRGGRDRGAALGVATLLRRRQPA